MVAEEFSQRGNRKTLLVLHPVKYTAAFRTGDFLTVKAFLVGDGDKHLTARFEDPE